MLYGLVCAFFYLVGQLSSRDDSKRKLSCACAPPAMVPRSHPVHLYKLAQACAPRSPKTIICEFWRVQCEYPLRQCLINHGALTHEPIQLMDRGAP